MSMFSGPDEHAANPPETWTVVRSGRVWLLTTATGATLDSFTTKTAAELAKTSGWLVRQYAKEVRWYVGENVPGWRTWAECLAERERIAARAAARREVA